jgi:phosphoglycerol transferase MdoB-like AlkP superfamily enzyme
MWQSLPLFELPASIGFPLILMGLFGWLCWRSETGLFGLLLLLGYMLAFAITGRPNNFYWGYLVSPLLMMGFIFVGIGLNDLQRALKRELPSTQLD